MRLNIAPVQYFYLQIKSLKLLLFRIVQWCKRHLDSFGPESISIAVILQTLFWLIYKILPSSAIQKFFFKHFSNRDYFSVFTRAIIGSAFHSLMQIHDADLQLELDVKEKMPNLRGT